MANFDMAELALKSICPTNALLYDDKGMPSVMVYIPKFRLCDVLSTEDTSIHPAFRKNGLEVDGFYFGKYQSSNYNGRAYSLPGETPSMNTRLDQVVAYNRAKGGGFHEATTAEWAAIALWCHKNGTEPKGNNDYGKDISETLYKAVRINREGIPDEFKVAHVATGTGPVTWSHDGTLEGIWDMNGNMWDWCTGMRLVYGELQVIPYNNAADPTCDLSETSKAWNAINAAATSWENLFVAPDGNGTTTGTVKLDFVSNHWQWAASTTSLSDGRRGSKFADITYSHDLSAFCKMYLQAMAIGPEECAELNAYQGNYVWANNGAPERAIYLGSYWEGKERSGLFTFGLDMHQGHHGIYVAGRSAYQN